MTDLQSAIQAAKEKQAERQKMTDWNTPYIPAAAEQAEKEARQTPRQARASALMAKAKTNAIRLSQSENE